MNGKFYPVWFGLSRPLGGLLLAASLVLAAIPVCAAPVSSSGSSSAEGVKTPRAEFPRGPLSPEQSARLLKAAPADSFVIVDVRQPEAFDEGHLPAAVNIPFEELEGRLAELPADKPVLLTCQTGSLAAEACDLLREKRPELTVAYIKARVSFPAGKPYRLGME